MTLPPGDIARLNIHAANAQLRQATKSTAKVIKRFAPGAEVLVRRELRGDRKANRVYGHLGVDRRQYYPARALIVRESNTTPHFYKIKWLTQGLTVRDTPGTTSTRLFPFTSLLPVIQGYFEAEAQAVSGVEAASNADADKEGTEPDDTDENCIPASGSEHSAEVDDSGDNDEDSSTGISTAGVRAGSFFDVEAMEETACDDDEETVAPERDGEFNGFIDDNSEGGEPEDKQLHANFDYEGQAQPHALCFSFPTHLCIYRSVIKL